MNYQPGPETPGHISESLRFGGMRQAKDNLNTKIGF